MPASTAPAAAGGPMRRLPARVLGRIRRLLLGERTPGGAPQRTQSRYDTLHRLFQDEVSRKRHILEIGTYTGNTAITLLRSALRQERPESVHYYGFDLFEDLDDETLRREVSKRPTGTLEEIRARISAESGLPLDHVHLFRGYTSETLWRELPRLPRMDFIFIDGGHSTETVENDWRACSQLMDADTVVVLDDYYHVAWGPRVVVDALDPREYHVQVLEPQDVFADRFGVAPDGKLRINLVEVRKTASTAA